ncbi:endonuclease MutS2 [Helicobacter cappadocius]|uniref:Endonuclease MutS2 n=1 Tax=Helicobacter cappadocius TaxID=3063998 RepID=A0AA90PKJ9_9HELI|nr:MULTISPECIES: endonuclease MutS2 [unclassified Helicobacter]MDO7252796.1 endonuclease MutS2 [Helicobacter sp. faydin-H75]MDP2538839.1 endonuclease MutS2 [Helicobacter sp. faydin-H76]
MQEKESYQYEEIVKKLDLEDFIRSFTSFFSRIKPIHLQGDKSSLVSFIKDLENIVFSPPPKTKKLDISILHLKKFGTLKLEEIFEFIKIIRYFSYLKSLSSITEDMFIYKYLQNINIPQEIKYLMEVFDCEAQIKSGIYDELDSLILSISRQKTQISKILGEILQSNKLVPYLVDRQIHYINGNETLLLKSGFNSAIKGIIISRSQSGFFYLLPSEIHNIHQKISEFEEKLQICLYNICKELSAILRKHILFLSFIDREFDKFDHLQARINFAKAYNLEFVTHKTTDKTIILKGFSHPALSHPKPIDIEFKNQLLMVTGVNAGGKTMLLKSILSSVFLAKHLLPMKINAYASRIPNFKNIFAIIADPQNSKNDISTFAGRMLHFSQILNTQDLIIGVDEIELGTDADEASSLYKVLLEHLLDKNAKIIITTHHKRLAALMASDSRIQMCAAIFDENAQVPTYGFLHGSIGKSYAFETAKRYGIPTNLIIEAKKIYGEDKEKLNELIEKSATLEIELSKKTSILDMKIEEYDKKKQEQQEIIETLKRQYAKQKFELDNIYNQALNEIKSAIKAKESSEMHRSMNNANKIIQAIRQTLPSEQFKNKKEFRPGDHIRYGVQDGIVLGKTGKNNEFLLVELDSGIKLKISPDKLKHISKAISNNQLPHKPRSVSKTKKQKIDFSIDKNTKNSVNVSLDLHGLRSEEAIEKLDKFLSDALIAGFDEVLIYHGIGTGKLSFSVKEFLSSHPKVISFCDAPIEMGGFGAKLVRL